MSHNLLLKGNKQKVAVALDTAISYSELTELFSEHLKEDKKSVQAIKNARSVIKSWCELLKFEINDCIGEEFEIKFESSLRHYIRKQTELRIQKSTYSSRVCLIRTIRKFYLSKNKSVSLPPNFSDRIRHLLKINNYSCQSFWRFFLKGTLNYTTLVGWTKGRHTPCSNKVYIIRAIENHLNVPDGTLTSTLTTRLTNSSAQRDQKEDSALKINREPIQKYCVFPPIVDAEYAPLVDFKTSVIPPIGMNRRKKSLWTGDKGELAPSAIIFKKLLSRFFGFCCLPYDSSIAPKFRGLGFKESELSLALLTDVQILEEFITVFLPARSKGAHNGGTFLFIAIVASLLMKKTGYIYQKPELGSRIGLSDDIADWQERCLRTRQRILDIQNFIKDERAAGGENFRLGRDPKERINMILKAERPIHITMKMVARMLSDVEKLSGNPMKQAILYRDMLLTAMLQANPLRAKMFSIMKFEEHLVRRNDGSWWLKFKKNEFKNRRFLKGDYQVRVAPDLWLIIDNYRNNFRTRFDSSEVSSHVFITEKKLLSNNSSDRRLTPQMLSNRIVRRTREYIADCKGFRAHSFRHIVCTDIIKNNPGVGYFLAAKVLNDKLETVEENYAHLETSEFFEPYNNIFSEAWKFAGSDNSKLSSCEPLSNHDRENESGGI